MEERYSISDAIIRLESPLRDEMWYFYSLGIEDGKNDVLDKIISEATSLKISYTDHDKDTYRRGINDMLKIIDEYKGKTK